MPTHSAFSDPEFAPLLNRISFSSAEFANSYIRCLNFFGWTHANILVSLLAGWKDIAVNIEKYGATYNISANILDIGYMNTPEEIAENDKKFQAIIDSKIRIILIFNYPRPKKMFLEYAADAGL